MHGRHVGNRIAHIKSPACKGRKRKQDKRRPTHRTVHRYNMVNRDTVLPQRFLQPPSSEAVRAFFQDPGRQAKQRVKRGKLTDLLGLSGIILDDLHVGDVAQACLGLQLLLQTPAHHLRKRGESERSAGAERQGSRARHDCASAA